MKKSWERMDLIDWVVVIGLFLFIAVWNQDALYRIYDSLTAAPPTVERKLLAEQEKSKRLEQELNQGMSSGTIGSL